LNLLVTGMHRSGTSALAGALRAAGMYGGREADQMATNAENPLGFSELRTVMDFNDRLLESLGWTWDAPATSPLQPTPARDALVDEGRRLVDETLGADGPWLLKDPRLAVLLPWWRQILLDRFAVAVTVRPMREVAWSLSVRNGFPPELGLALWAAYHRHLAAGLDGLPVVVVDYVALTARPDEVVPRIFDELEAMGIQAPLDRAAGIGHVQPSLHRPTQPAGADEGDGALERLTDIERSWSMGDVAAHKRFGLQTEPAGRWESALLELQRERRAEQHRRIAAEQAAARIEVAEAKQREMAARLSESDVERQKAHETARLLSLRITHYESERAELLARLAAAEESPLRKLRRRLSQR
jgi:hypothetical protein